MNIFNLQTKKNNIAPSTENKQWRKKMMLVQIHCCPDSIQSENAGWLAY